jgi:hypothetical protein
MHHLVLDAPSTACRSLGYRRIPAGRSAFKLFSFYYTYYDISVHTHTFSGKITKTPFLIPLSIAGKQRISCNNGPGYGHTASTPRHKLEASALRFLAPPLDIVRGMGRRADHDCRSVYPFMTSRFVRGRGILPYAILVSWRRVPGIIDHCQSLWTTTHSRYRILKTLHAKLKSTWSTPRLVATVMAKGKPVRSKFGKKTLLLTMRAIQLRRIRKWRRSENSSGEA